MTTCKTEMCKKDIYNRKEFLKWAVKGGHPNKGGSTKIFQVLSACADKQIFCDLYTKPRPAKPKTPPKAKPRSPPKPYIYKPNVTSCCSLPFSFLETRQCPTVASSQGFAY